MKGQHTNASVSCLYFYVYAFISAFQKKSLALGLLTSVVARVSKHAREVVEQIAETRVSLVPRV